MMECSRSRQKCCLTSDLYWITTIDIQGVGESCCVLVGFLKSSHKIGEPRSRHDRSVVQGFVISLNPFSSCII